MNRPSSLITIALVLLLVFATFNIIFQQREEKVDQPAELIIEDIKVEVVEEEEEVGPRVALVLDDFGYSKKNFEKLKDLGIPVTMAVLPNVPYSKKACDVAKENGFEVILHMPMEPIDNAKPMEKDTILVVMDDPVVESKIDGALNSIYSAKGISNHMGSRATGDKRLMELVFSDLKKRDLFFLDSYTSGNSLCSIVCRRNYALGFITSICCRGDIFCSCWKHWNAYGDNGKCKNSRRNKKESKQRTFNSVLKWCSHGNVCCWTWSSWSIWTVYLV